MIFALHGYILAYHMKHALQHNAAAAQRGPELHKAQSGQGVPLYAATCIKYLGF